MKSWLRTSLVIGTVSYYVACAPVKFGTDGAAPGDPTTPGVTCAGTSCYSQHHDQITIARQPVDILFIVDDSGSVSDIQASIAARFGSLLSQLGKLDYRIGITTTDVSSSASDSYNNPASVPNRNGLLQDGKLIQVSGTGDYFVTPQTPNPGLAFGNTIKIPETLACENAGYDPAQCPSGDPRAIYAANLLIGNNPQDFLRPNVPLTIVIVSDSDERNSSEGEYATAFPQGPLDKTDSIAATLQSKFPGKSLVVDAIVTKPGDTACYNSRYGRNGNPNLFAFYAPVYANLVSKTGGVLGSICENDYANQLGKIGAGASAQAQTVTLACQPPGNAYTVTYDPQPLSAITTSVDWATKKLTFSQMPPADTVVTVNYQCAQ